MLQRLSRSFSGDSGDSAGLSVVTQPVIFLQTHSAGDTGGRRKTQPVFGDTVIQPVFGETVTQPVLVKL